MSYDSASTDWLAALKAGDDRAVGELWHAFYTRLVGVAASRLRGMARRVADEEDVALSAFDSFLQGLRAGRYPDLHDRDDLWKLLVVITTRKAADLANFQRRRKRGNGAVRGESIFQRSGASSNAAGWDDIAGDEPSPEFAILIRERLECLLKTLSDDGLREIAVARLEGYSVDEIACRFQVVPRTIERKLRLIRRIWSEGPQP
jgi:DNA-directed RNA polymerase specialized sigma24 family protein